MTKLADEIEALAKVATQGPWDIEPMPGATAIAIADGNLIRTLVHNVPAILSALREGERLRGALTLIAAHRGKTLIGDDNSYSVGAHDAFESCGGIAEDALSQLDQLEAAGG